MRKPAHHPDAWAFSSVRLTQTRISREIKLR
jgi:hypothetical protein